MLGLLYENPFTSFVGIFSKNSIRSIPTRTSLFRSQYTGCRLNEVSPLADPASRLSQLVGPFLLVLSPRQPGNISERENPNMCITPSSAPNVSANFTIMPELYYAPSVGNVFPFPGFLSYSPTDEFLRGIVPAKRTSETRRVESPNSRF